MSDGGKKSSVFPQIFAGIVLAICAGGSSPWWLTEIKGLMSGPPGIEADGTDERKSIDSELEKLDKQDLAKRQRELEAELTELKRNQTRDSDAQEASDVDIGGVWRTGEDTYTFVQHGTGVTLSVYEGEVGMITMIGSGTITGQEATLSMQTALQTTGTFRMTVGDNGDALSGVYTDATGFQFSCELTRLDP